MSAERRLGMRMRDVGPDWQLLLPDYVNQCDVAFPFQVCSENVLRASLAWAKDCLSWSINLANNIYRPQPAIFLFMGTHERSGVSAAQLQVVYSATQYQGVLYSQNTIWFCGISASKCDFIYTHEESTAFPIPVFTKLINIERHYVQIRYAEFYPNRITNMKVRIKIHLRCEVKYVFCQTDFLETHNHSVNFCDHLWCRMLFKKCGR